MKRFVISIVFLLCCICVSAQKLKVDKFIVKSNDISARTHPRQDINGNDCALVKVHLATQNANFDGNVIGDVSYETSIYNVYMSQGSKRLTIRLEGYLPLQVNFPELGVNKLETKTVYELTISGTHHSDLFDKKSVDEIYKMIIKLHKKNKDISELIDACINTADQGDTRAQNLVGILYKKGVGVVLNYNEAVKWFKKAADQGYPAAQFNLGNMFDDGLGVPQNSVEAVNWFKKAADQGYPAAQFNLGIQYYKGEGVRKDIPLAIEWLQKAANQGNKAARRIVKQIIEVYEAGGYD